MYVLYASENGENLRRSLSMSQKYIFQLGFVSNCLHFSKRIKHRLFSIPPPSLKAYINDTYI